LAAAADKFGGFGDDFSFMITSRTTGNALPVVFVFPVVGPMLRSRAGAGSLGIADRIWAPAPR
jgi:hypothetical protein